MLTVCNRWDGEYADGTITRPGYKMPWAYTVQPSGRVDDWLTWAVHSQSGRAVGYRWKGDAATIEEARAAAETATQ